MTAHKPVSTRQGPRVPKTFTRSFRVRESVWDRYSEKTRNMGLSPSGVLTRLVEGFVAGDVTVPSVRYVFEGEKIEDDARGVESESAAEAAKALGDDFDSDMEI